jgi:predicted dehydrogenase
VFGRTTSSAVRWDFGKGAIWVARPSPIQGSVITIARINSQRERVHAATATMQPVTIDDACMFLAEFANGADGSVYFELEEPEYLQYFEYINMQTGKKVESHLTGWRKVHVTNSEHPYMSHYWVPGTCIGYEHTFLNAIADFVKGIETGVPVQPGFRCALQTQKVRDAVIQSAREGRWLESGA